MIKASTFEYEESLEKKVNETGYAQLKLHVGDFSKQIADDAVYHKGCHANSMSPKQKLEKELSAHDLAFNKLISEIEPYPFLGKAYDISSLLESFKQKLLQDNAGVSGES